MYIYTYGNYVTMMFPNLQTLGGVVSDYLYTLSASVWKTNHHFEHLSGEGH